MILGYARVSTEEQNLDLQINALTRAGCELRDIYTDRASGSDPRRPAFAALMQVLAAGDTLIVWRLDRLTRGVRHLLEIVPEIERRRVRLVSTTEAIDTTHAAGRLMISVLGSLAEYERDQLQERIRAGITAARGRGMKFGRPRALSNDQVLMARTLEQSGATRRRIAISFGVSRMTIAAALDRTGPYARMGEADDPRPLTCS